MSYVYLCLKIYGYFYFGLAASIGYAAIFQPVDPVVAESRSFLYSIEAAVVFFGLGFIVKTLIWGLENRKKWAYYCSISYFVLGMLNFLFPIAYYGFFAILKRENRMRFQYPFS